MIWSNYHGHSHYCDGKGAIEEYIEEALKQGMKTIGISSHAPLPFETLWAMPQERLKEYIDEVACLKAKYEGKIQVYTGLEVDFIPETIGPEDESIKQLSLDYNVGSVHFVDQFPDGIHFEADGSRLGFIKAIDQIFEGDVQKLVKRYFELVRMMLTTSTPTILGHLDKIKIQNSDGLLFDENAGWYKDEMMETLDVLAVSGIIMEVNTRGLYKKKCDATYPSLWVLKEAFKRSIPVTINSDAHHPRELTGDFEFAASEVKAAGYSETFHLWDGIWQSRSL